MVFVDDEKATLRSDRGGVFTSPGTTSVRTKRNYAPSVPFDFDNANLRGIEECYSQGPPRLGKIFFEQNQGIWIPRKLIWSSAIGH